MNRRDFLAAAGSAAAGMRVLGSKSFGTAGLTPRSGIGPTILFQGDSITDGGRDRDAGVPNLAAGLGTGYPWLIASSELAAHPDRGFLFFNRGVSGNRVPDLDSRWATDALALKPDLLSILVGVNDYWHTLNGDYRGTVDEYEAGYAALLDRTRRRLPATRLVVLEPFILRCGVVTDAWVPEFARRRAAAARVAQAAGAAFLPLQALFDQLSSQAPPVSWSSDGVHPTPAGHAAIARAWMDAVTL
jgi:lysophospholipase L1-like esterase